MKLKIQNVEYELNDNPTSLLDAVTMSKADKSLLFDIFKESYNASMVAAKIAKCGNGPIIGLMIEAGIQYILDALKDAGALDVKVEGGGKTVI